MAPCPMLAFVPERRLACVRGLYTLPVFVARHASGDSVFVGQCQSWFVCFVGAAPLGYLNPKLRSAKCSSKLEPRTASPIVT